jgi:hypothetical protein
MRKELFDELVESVKEGMAILRGKKEPSRVFVVEKKQDVKSRGLQPKKTAAPFRIS